MLPGKGISASIDGQGIFCGNNLFLQENSIAIQDMVVAKLEELRKEGKATIIVANNSAVIGLIALSDTLRSTAKQMVQQLAKTGTKTVLLTGDHIQSARYFAEKVGIDTVHAQLLPEQKVEEITALQKQGHIVCMIGDGVNDAPALKTANVGVAMGNMGSDIAIEAADIALIGDDIAKIIYLKRLSSETIKTIKFNISLAMVINFVAIVLSVYGVLNPITGALVHNAGSVLVVLNAALLYDRDFSMEPKAIKPLANQIVKS